MGKTNTHPYPFVIHPFKYLSHSLSEVSVFEADKQVLTAQLLELFTYSQYPSDPIIWLHYWPV